MATVTQVWIAYGLKPRTRQVMSAGKGGYRLIAKSPVKVIRVVGYDFAESRTAPSLTTHIHNNIGEKEVLLGVLGFPIQPTAERATKILNMRSSGRKDVIGHFPGKPTHKEATAIRESRFIEESIAGRMFRNTMYSSKDCEESQAYDRSVRRL